jgi:hypothetical protein
VRIWFWAQASARSFRTHGRVPITPCQPEALIGGLMENSPTDAQVPDREEEFTLFEWLGVVLKQVAPFSKHDMDGAFEMISKRRLELMERNFEGDDEEGPCLVCRTKIIEYRRCSAHVTNGHWWFCKLKDLFGNKGLSELVEYHRNGHYKISRFCPRTVKGYICKRCFHSIEALVDQLQHKENEKIMQESRRWVSQPHRQLSHITNEERETIIKWFMSKDPEDHKKVLPVENPMVFVDRYNISDLLKNLPYDDFLQTTYWMMVKRRAINRGRRVCGHCGKPDKLHVHHLTYEHHGAEHNHYEDLIPLCAYCHAAVHNKEPHV